jgi:hypothetical protein
LENIVKIHVTAVQAPGRKRKWAEQQDELMQDCLRLVWPADWPVPEQRSSRFRD